MNVDFSKSLNQLTGEPPDPGPFDRDLPGRHRRACETPVRYLEADQIRTLIGQNTDLDILASYLMSLLQDDPLAALDGEKCFWLLFENIEQEFWPQHPDLQAEAVELLLKLDKKLPEDWIDFAIFFIAKNTGDGSPKLSFWGEKPDPD